MAESPRDVRARKRALKRAAEESFSGSDSKGSSLRGAAKLKPSPKKGWLPAHFAGTGPNGLFFETPEFVDKSLPPGMTPQPVNATYLRNYFTLAFMFYSPNLVWFLFAALDYVAFPYDIGACETLGSAAFRGFLVHRFFVNVLFTFGYSGFWHVCLYKLGWGERKFNPARMPAPSRMLHNLWYSSLGCLQWSVWEGCFVHLFATGKMPHVSDAAAFTTAEGAARFLAWFFLVPLFRDFHFYFAHRLIHIRCLYKYVHSLHHRNTDIEPFSGLCMHPIEHLYYFACVCPLVYCLASPFAVMWMGIHLLLSPAASHSGWEDHFQSDQYHYLHHAKFECNYGTSGIPFDKWFGTFREKLGKSEAYKGAATAAAVAAGNPDDATKGGADSAVAYKSAKEVKAAMRSMASGAAAKKRADKFDFPALPNRGMGVYFVATAAIFAVFLAAILDSEPDGIGLRLRTLHLSVAGISLGAPQLVGLLVSVGPVVAGLVGCVLSRDRFSLRWPFHKDSLLGGFGFHALVGFFFCILPVYHVVAAVLGDKGDSAYCQIWGGC